MLQHHRTEVYQGLGWHMVTVVKPISMASTIPAHPAVIWKLNNTEVYCLHAIIPQSVLLSTMNLVVIAHAQQHGVLGALCKR